MQEKLAKMSEIARQGKQKKWYDHNAREQLGDYVATIFLTNYIGIMPYPCSTETDDRHV